MRRLSRLLLSLLPMCLLSPLGVGPLQAQGGPDLRPFEARQLAPGIHLLKVSPDFLGAAISNITVIEQSDGMVVIDSGATIAHGRRVVDFIRSITDKPVKAVVITHWHNDHPLGVGAIREAWPRVRVISTVRTRAGLLGPASTSVARRPDERFDTSILNLVYADAAQMGVLANAPDTSDEQRERYLRRARQMIEFGRDFRGTYLVPPTETFARELLLDDAERPVRLMFLGRANTDGDAIAWLPQQRMVMAGDVVVSPIPFGFFSYPEDWIGVLQRLKALDYALLVPGHGDPMTDTSYLDRLIATIEDIRAQVGPLARQGVPLDQIQSRVDFSAQSAIFGTTPRLRAGFQSLWLTPMIENAYKEARGIRIYYDPEGETPTRAAERTGNRR